MKRLALLVAASLALPHPALPQETPRYKDARQPVEARVADLLGRMTLEEKVAQLQALWIQKSKIYEPIGTFSAEKARTVMPHGLGQIARPSESTAPGPGGPPVTREPREHAEFVNAVQKYALSTRLGIPVMFHEEALHGLAAPKGTHFPIPMALGATWDPALIERVMSVAAKEARARGCQQVLSPVLDLARDPRWGRTEETYGEDPYLVTKLGLAAIRGYQGPGLPLAPDKVFATAKHFAAHGPHEGGINTAPTSYGERYLREELLAPFEAAIKEAKPHAVMPSYNEIDGVPAHQNKWLLDTLLRKEWGFDGVVTSDYFAIQQLKDRHGTAADAAEAARRSLLAGVDVELPDPDTFPTIVEQVKDGRIPQAAVDTAVARVLRAKFLAGLFENPYVDVEKVDAQTNTAEHQALALEAARKAIVLVKNDQGVLPLDRAKVRTLAVIGPNAKGVHLGGYSRDPGRGIDVLDGITKAAGAGVRVLYAEGVALTAEPSGITNWWRDKVTLADPKKNRERIQEAVGVAGQADAVVLVIGTNEALSREAWADEHLGDVTDLDLPGQQQELVDAVRATGKPVIALLLNGRPLSVTKVAETVPAILEGFYLGQEGGTAVGEVLFGDVNPGGRLPITFPRHVGQLPVWYGRKPTSFRDYLDRTRQPLWSFGHGLSYTTFEYSGLAVTPEQIGPGAAATVKVTVKNTGKVAGDEVAQLYIHDVVASVTRPRRALKGFQRVTLKPGESRELTFALTPAELSFIGEDMKRVVEPGSFEVFVGGRPDQLASAKLEVTAK
jgi:beta-glucosidase